MRTQLVRGMVGTAVLLSVPLGITVLSAARASSAYASTAGDSAAGKTIFLEQHCNLCHSLESDGIQRIIKSPAAAGPDLGGVVAKKGPEWTKKWLLREVEIKGQKHRKVLHLEDQQLTTLISWLEKQQPKKP
jgi:mono/diheme cytochrome c family protein